MSISNILNSLETPATKPEQTTMATPEVTEMISGEAFHEEVELTGMINAMEVGLDTITGLQDLAGEAFASVENGGLSSDSIAMLALGAKIAGATLNLDPIELPSGEEFEEAGQRVELSNLAGEGIKEGAAKVAKTIIGALESAAKFLAGLWNKYISKVGRYTTKIEAAKEKYKDLAGDAVKEKLAFNGKAIMEPGSKKLATASQLGQEAKDVSKLLAQLKDLKKGEYDVIENVLENFKGDEVKDEKVLKAIGMSEGYEKVVSHALTLGGDTLYFGIPTTASEKGPRAHFASGVGMDKEEYKAEFDALNIADTKGMFTAAGNYLEQLNEVAELAKDFGAAMDKIKKDIKAMSTETDEEAKARITKLKQAKDMLSISKDGLGGLRTHCEEAMVACFNWGLKNAKNFKAKKEDK